MLLALTSPYTASTSVHLCAGFWFGHARGAVAGKLLKHKALVFDSNVPFNSILRKENRTHHFQKQYSVSALYKTC